MHCIQTWTSPPAPKVPDRSELYEWTWHKHVRPSRLPESAEDCGNLHMLRIGPASPKCTVSIRHGRNIGSTWGQLRPVSPNLDPFGSNFGPIWLQNAQSEILKTPILTGIVRVFLLSLMLRLKCCVSVGPVKLSPKGPKLRHFGHDLDFHVHHVASLGPNFSPTSSWAQDSALWAWAKLGQPRFKRAQLILRTQCNTLKTCMLTATSNIFCL